MTDCESELLLLSDDIDAGNVSIFLDETGGVPLHVSSLMDKQMNVQEYANEVIEDVLDSLRKLKKETYWHEIVASSISCLLYLQADVGKMCDKKSLLLERTAPPGRQYKPLVQQVLTAYRSYLWKDLMTFVKEKEANLLAVCGNSATTNNVRACHFKAMVIRRCSSSNIDIQVGDTTVTIPSGRYAVGFSTRLLPQHLAGGLYFPFDPNFKAIDFFLKSGRYVFAVQTHVNEHDDVTNTFIGLCKQAGWFQRFDCIQLIYLSPEDAVANLVTTLVNPPVVWDALSTSQSDNSVARRITRRALTKESFACLRDLQWPNGCSLNSS